MKNSRSVMYFLSILVFLSIIFSFSGAQPASATENKQAGNVEYAYDPDSGLLVFIGASAEAPVLPLTIQGAPQEGESLQAFAQQNSMAFIGDYAAQIGLDNPNQNLAMTRFKKMDDGRLVSRFEQRYQGVSVWGAETIVNATRDGGLISLSTKISPNLDLDVNPRISAAEAQSLALASVAKYYQLDGSSLTVTEPQLIIFDEALFLNGSTTPVQLVWKMEVDAQDPNLASVREVVLVSAQQAGRIALSFSLIDRGAAESNLTVSSAAPAVRAAPLHAGSTNLFSPPASLGSMEISIYDMNHNCTAGDYPYIPCLGILPLPGTLVCTQADPSLCDSDPDSRNAYQYAKDTYDFYTTIHNRDSIDGLGLLIKSSVHYGSGFSNAFWDGTQMVYGDGFSSGDDVVGHELTHGVTENESNLTYWAQPGAINESFSDVWGEFVDQWNQRGNDSSAVKWLLGEDIAGGAIRSMKNPPLYGDPDSMISSKYYLGLGDSAGVHENSGVNNKAAYLMTDGGVFGGKTVTALGIEKTAVIYYEAQTNLLGSGANYFDLYYALYQACENTVGTHGITLADCQEVRDATDAVAMNKTKSAVSYPVAEYCPAGITTGNAAPIFADGFENLDFSTNWDIPSIGPNVWFRQIRDANNYNNPKNGEYYAKWTHGNSPGVTTGILEQKTAVAVPVGVNTYLRLEQDGYVEYYSTVPYDGMVVEYNVNGGPWLDASPLYSSGMTYQGVIPVYYGNAYGGRKAFSHTIYYNPLVFNLSSLAGQSVKIRFVVSTDLAYGPPYVADDPYPDEYWAIDDVQIYTCQGTPVMPVLSAPVNNSLTTDLTPLLNWNDIIPSLDHYGVQVDDNPDFSSPAVDEAAVIGSEYLVPSDLALNTKYYWRVKSFNAVNGSLGWSNAFSFKTPVDAPTLVEPLNSGALTLTRPTFTWTSVPNASGYTLVVSKYNPSFSPAVLSATVAGNGTTTYTPTADLPINSTLYWRVRANAIAPNFGPSAWSGVYSMSTTAAPSVPALLLPANNATLPNLTPPVLDWTTSTLAVGVIFNNYQVQVDNNAGFPSPEVDDSSITTLATSTFNLNPALVLTANTKYYWRVRACTSLPYCSSWSNVFYFKTAIDKPTLVAPADTLPLSAPRPAFSWNSVTNASGYTLAVSKYNTLTFSPLVFSVTLTGNGTTTYTYPADLPINSTLYWRVRANAIAPNFGPSAWSDVYSMTTAAAPGMPVLLTPIKNVTLLNLTFPVLDWVNSIVTAPVIFDHYQVQVDDSASFLSPEVDDSSITLVTTSTLSTGPGLTANTKYNWRVRACAAPYCSSWSSVFSFSTAMPAPTLVAPADTLTLLTNRPTFSWNLVPNASGYTLMVSKNNLTFSPLVFSVGLAGNGTTTYTHPADLPINSTLYWRVRANATAPNTQSSDWSVINTMTSIVAPSIPTLVSPAINFLTFDYTPLLDWNNSTLPVGAVFVHYQIQVDDAANFSSPAVNAESGTFLVDSNYTVPSALDVNTKYFWRVRACDDSDLIGLNDKCSAWSLTRYFRTALPPPALSTPAASAKLPVQKPVFDWADVAGVSNYTIQVSTSSTFNTMVINITAPSSTYTPTINLETGATLYWRVRSNGTNGPGDWAAYRAFVIFR